jgi:BASS family bile acid:Na+ symporter
MQPSIATDIFLPVALGVVMLGLGLKLQIADFRRVAEAPRTVAIGLLVQMTILPLWALLLAWGMPPELGLGLMLLAASPGGPTANLYSALAGGDVALNLTLTAINSALSVVWVPLVVQASVAMLLGDQVAVPLQTGKVGQVLAVVLLPVAVGMALRARRAAWAARLERPVRVLSVLLLAVIILGLAIANFGQIGSYLVSCGPAVLALNLGSLGLGWWVPRRLGLGARQAVAIALEIGIHNGTLAIAVALQVLGRPEAAVPAALYSLLAYGTAGVFAVLARRHLSSLDADNALNEESAPPA